MDGYVFSSVKNLFVKYLLDTFILYFLLSIATAKSGFISNPIFESNKFHQVENNVECGMNGSSRRGSPAGPNDIVWNIN